MLIYDEVLFKVTSLNYFWPDLEYFVYLFFTSNKSSSNR